MKMTSVINSSTLILLDLGKKKREIMHKEKIQRQKVIDIISDNKKLKKEKGEKSGRVISNTSGPQIVDEKN